MRRVMGVPATVRNCVLYMLLSNVTCKMRLALSTWPLIIWKAKGEAIMGNILEQAMILSEEHCSVSVSWLQRKLRISYSTAAGLVDQMQAAGFCSKKFDKQLPGYHLLPHPVTENSVEIACDICMHWQPINTVCGVCEFPGLPGGTTMHDESCSHAQLTMPLNSHGNQ
jgi:hypothetical protein